jgi:bifunctional DNase/RNase
MATDGSEVLIMIRLELSKIRFNDLMEQHIIWLSEVVESETSGQKIVPEKSASETKQSDKSKSKSKPVEATDAAAQDTPGPAKASGSSGGDVVPGSVKPDEPSGGSPAQPAGARTGRVFPIVIGTNEAIALRAGLDGLRYPRPQTHDLLLQVIDSLGGVIERIEITDLREATFFAELVLKVGRKRIRIDCRPSDALVLSVKRNIPVYTTPAVLEQAI